MLVRVSTLKYGAQAAVKACSWLAPVSIAMACMPWIDHAAHADLQHAASARLLPWIVMILAMIPVLLQPLMRYVFRRSYPDRRWLNVGTLILGYAIVWLVAAMLTTASLHALVTVQIPSAWIPPSLAVCAALWQISPVKRAALQFCHRSAPIRGEGFAAMLCSARLGASHGGYCLLTCLPVMTAAMWMPSHRAAMVAAAALACYERVARRPDLELAAAIILTWGFLDQPMPAAW